MKAIRKIPSLVAKLPADPLSLWERDGVRVLASPEWGRDGVRVLASPEWERDGVRVPASPEWERAGVRVRSMSAKLECSTFHHSYFTLHSSTGGMGYGG